MIERYIHKSVTWFDVLNPTTEEIRQLIDEAKIPADFANDLTSMTPLTEVHATKQALKLTLDFPIVKRTDINHPHEIKFIATKKHLVTIRFEDIESIHRFSKEFEVLGILSKSKSLTGGVLCVSLLTFLYEAMQKKLDYLETRLHDIEEGIFTEHEKEMVFEISNLARRVIAFRQTIAPHHRLLEELPEKFALTFGKNTTKHIEGIVDSHHHLVARLTSVSRTLDDLRDTNMAILSTKQNEIMKILTIMAFITFPLTLFTSLFGMNTVTTPLVGQPGDFWLILSIMLVVSILFFAYFRYKKWM
ncbi:MAG: magnesium transporter CorA family protein [Patescibacteria group bacterium]